MEENLELPSIKKGLLGLINIADLVVVPGSIIRLTEKHHDILKRIEDPKYPLNFRNRLGNNINKGFFYGLIAGLEIGKFIITYNVAEYLINK